MNFLRKKFTSPFNPIKLNTTYISISFHGQTSLKDTIFSVLKSGIKLLQIGLRNALMDMCFLTPQYIDCNQIVQTVTHTLFMFYCKLSKTTLDFIRELIYLNHSFNIPFKIGLKTIIMGDFSQFYDDVELKILPALLEVFLKHFSYCRVKTFHDGKYDKLNELFNFNVILFLASTSSEILLLNWTPKKPF